MEEFTKVERFSVIRNEIASNFDMFALEPSIDHNVHVASSAPEQIFLTFSCRVIYSSWILYEDNSIEPELLTETVIPLRETSNHITNIHQQVPIFLARALMGGWLMWPEAHLKLVDFTVKKAEEAVRLVPPNHNGILHLNINIVGTHKHIYVERHEPIDWAIQQSMDVDEVQLVPAKESSIESLEKKKVSTMESETCSICLEEFLGSCETVSMPCSHFFHKNCIKKWLRISHYCPICRFEMPTS